MGYLQFSTANANYTFQCVNHFWTPINLGIMNSVDAIATETLLSGTEPIFSDTKRENQILTTTTYGNRKLIKQIRDGAFPTFSVGVNIDWKYYVDSTHGKTPKQIQIEGRRKYHWQNAQQFNPEFSFRDLYFFFRYSVLSGKIPQSYIDHKVEKGSNHKLPETVARSVFTAEKIEKGFVQFLKNRLQIEKPHIAILHGYQHIDMIAYLQDESLRKEIVKHYKKNNYQPLDRGTLEQITEFVFSEQGEPHWKVKKIKLKVLKRKRNKI